jgi:DNA-binding MarR family transcriptional regulator
LNLTHPQYLVMLALWQKSPRSVKDLSQRLVLGSATISPLLKRLEGRGYLTRRRVEGDERSLAVALTPEGTALRDKAVTVPGAILDTLGLTRSEAEDLQERMTRLARSARIQHWRPGGSGWKSISVREMPALYIVREEGGSGCVRQLQPEVGSSRSISRPQDAGIPKVGLSQTGAFLMVVAICVVAGDELGEEGRSPGLRGRLMWRRQWRRGHQPWNTRGGGGPVRWFRPWVFPVASWGQVQGFDDDGEGHGPFDQGLIDLDLEAVGDRNATGTAATPCEPGSKEPIRDLPSTWGGE